MRNPHSPTKDWLDSIATGESGYDNDAEEGDEGSITLERGEVEFEVTVECLGEVN